MSASHAPLTADSEPLSDLTPIAIRHGFVRKVYGILFAQLLATVAVGACIYNMDIQANPFLVEVMLLGSFVMAMSVMCFFMCRPETMRKTPMNYILLSVFTLAEAVLVGFISSAYTQESVLLVMGITAAVVLSLSLYACQTSRDFTGMGPYLFAMMMTLCAFGFVVMIGNMLGLSGPGMQGARLLYAGGGALLFSMYIVFNTQMIIGGKAQYKFNIDDYAMAAIVLYMNIIRLFIFLLRLFGQRRQ